MSLREKGFLLPVFCLSLAGILFVSTLGVYQAYYACMAAQEYYRACQADYCLDGMFNQTVDECAHFIQTTGAFHAVRTYTVDSWPLCQPQRLVVVTIEPQQKEYKITLKWGDRQKVGYLKL